MEHRGTRPQQISTDGRHRVRCTCGTNFYGEDAADARALFLAHRKAVAARRREQLR